MENDEIVQRLIAYLDQHLHGTRGYMGQSPYRDDLFALCRQAFDNGAFDGAARPRLTADGMIDVVRTRWRVRDETKRDEQESLLEDLRRRWNEWQFVLQKLG